MDAVPVAQDRRLSVHIDVPAPLERVWEAWTTEAGVRTFFAPACRIDLRPGGAYEMLFDLDAEAGRQGGEGNRILALQPSAMLSFTWNAPPQIPLVRDQRTHVTVSFHPIDLKHTRLRLLHDGWGEGGDWDRAYAYFDHAWGKIVLPRLRYRFMRGPIEWENPPADLAPAARA